MIFLFSISSLDIYPSFYSTGSFVNLSASVHVTGIAGLATALTVSLHPGDDVARGAPQAQSSGIMRMAHMAAV